MTRSRRHSARRKTMTSRVIAAGLTGAAVGALVTAVVLSNKKEKEDAAAAPKDGETPKLYYFD